VRKNSSAVIDAAARGKRIHHQIDKKSREEGENAGDTGLTSLRSDSKGEKKTDHGAKGENYREKVAVCSEETRQPQKEKGGRGRRKFIEAWPLYHGGGRKSRERIRLLIEKNKIKSDGRKGPTI